MPPILKEPIIIVLNLAIGFIIGIVILLVLDMCYTGGQAQRVLWAVVK